MLKKQKKSAMLIQMEKEYPDLYLWKVGNTNTKTEMAKTLSHI